jgi:uncharacterized protein (DUF488 family)
MQIALKRLRGSGRGPLPAPAIAEHDRSATGDNRTVPSPREIYTVGHSTHPAERFVDLVRRHGVEVVCDVRRYPGSRRNPQFNTEALRESLAAAGVSYEPFGDELGGRRKPRASDGPGPWRNASFRGYAEYMETPEFAAGLERLERLASRRRAAIMCAEAQWRRCHRRLLSDALSARGWRVIHIRADGVLEEHEQTLALP